MRRIFTIGGKEEGKQDRSYNTKKEKVLCAMGLTDRGKVKRFYALKTPDFPQNHYEQYLANTLVK